jgi:glycosyltransferase involved in cell wall biosynthesis
MNVLSIGTDRALLNFKSESARRHIAYGVHFDELNIIVFSRSGGKATLSTGVHVYPTRSPSRLFYGLDALRIAWRLQRPDVVTVQDPFETGLVGFVIARMRGAQFHVQVHTDFFSPSYAHSSLNRVRKVIAGFVLRRAARIRVVSNRIKEGIEKMRVQVPIAVLPIYTDVQKFRDARAGELAGRFSKFPTRILVVSRLEREKNVALAVMCFAKVAPSNACLIIVGEGRERAMLAKNAKKLGVDSRVFFEGQRDPASYYALASLVLFPSHYDGYGLVIIEALAAGKPVLATDFGIAREAGAIVVDEDHFADALAAWFESGDRTGTLRGYPYQSFEEYVKKYCDDISATKSGLA